MISLPPGGRYDRDHDDQNSECHIVADMIKIMTKTNMIRMPPNDRYDQDQDDQNATRWQVFPPQLFRSPVIRLFVQSPIWFNKLRPRFSALFFSTTTTAAHTTEVCSAK